MAIHENLKPSDQELPLLLAGKALTGVRSLASRPTGTISIDNADGTSTIIGNNDSGDSGVAEQVGKTSLPGTPTGLTVASMGLTVSLMWDGTTDGVEHVSGLVAVLEDAAGVQVPMGQLHGAGSLVAPATVPGLAHVTAYTVDNAHADDGTSQPNKSESVTLDIVLSEIVDSQAIDDQIKQVNRTLDDNRQKLEDNQNAIDANQKALEENKKTLDQANTDLTAARKELADSQSRLTQAEENVKKNEDNLKLAYGQADTAKTTADNAKKTADQASKDAQDASNAASSAASQAREASERAASALANANQALARATHVTMSPSTPSSPTRGDVWFPTDSSGRATGMRQWDGASWVDVQLVAGSVLVPGSVGSTLIADGAVTTPKLEAGSVDASKIAAGSITSGKIVSGAITSDKIAANAVSADKIQANSIGSDKLTANAVHAQNIAAGAVNADKLAANSVTADKLGANAVTADKIAANSVGADQLKANAITADKIAAGAVTSAKIAAGSIDADKIQGNKLIGTEIQTSDKPPYMLLRNQSTNLSDIQLDTNTGELSLIGEGDSNLGGITFLRQESTSGANDIKSYGLYITVVDPQRRDDVDHGNEISLTDDDTSFQGTAGSSFTDHRNIKLQSREISIYANDGGIHRNYSFNPEGFMNPDVGYYLAHKNLYKKYDSEVQGGHEDIYLDSSIHVDDYPVLDFEYVSDSEQVHGSQRFYQPDSGTWVGFKFALTMNYMGRGNYLYANSLMMTFLSQTHLNTIQLPSGEWASGQYQSGGRAQYKDVMWVTRIEGWKG